MQINRRQIIVYPCLFAIYPLLHLYVTNIHLLEFRAVAIPLLVILGATLALYLAANWLLKASTSAGILTTAIVVAILYYGVVYDVVGTVGAVGAAIQRHEYLLPTWITLFVLVGTLAVRKRGTSAQTDAYLNFLSVAIIGVALAPGIVSVVHDTTRDLSSEPTDISPVVSHNPTRGRSLGARIELETLPDVYYIILDGYGRQDVLLDYYDFDNSAFIDSMTKKGFRITSESRSNYSQTAMSLPSSLNVDYLDAIGILDDGLSKKERISKSIRFLSGEVSSYLERQFKELGYKTIYFKHRNPLLANELSLRVLNTTIGRPIAPEYNMRLRRQHILETFDKLKEIPKFEEPTFTFAHILAPHPPFVFDREGNFTGVTGFNPGNAWVPKQMYTDQLLHINHLTEELVDSILAQSETPPIIVIQADHGTLSTGMKARETLSILNAYYLPSGGEQFLYPSITPVNSFRLILDLYFGTNLGLLEDRSYVAPELYAYEFLCEADNNFPDDTAPQIWAANATKTLIEHSYHMSVAEDCEFQKFILMNDNFMPPGQIRGKYYRWVGPSQSLQFPVEANQNYIFRAKVRHMLPDGSQEVRLLIDDKLVDSTTISARGDSEITFIVPAEQIPTEPFVRVKLEHSYSQIGYGGSPRELSLAYYWIEWIPGSEAEARYHKLCSITFSTGWHNREGGDLDWWHWTDGQGQVIVSVQKETEAALHGELRSIQQPNKVDILVNGEKLITLDVNWDGFGAPAKSLPLHLKAGENIIEFISHNPAITPPSDSRPLAIAVKNLRLTFGPDDGSFCELYHQRAIE